MAKFRIQTERLISDYKCRFFYINRDDKWCIRRGLHKNIPLEEYPRENLEELIEEILDSDEVSIPTIINIEDIKREILNNDNRGIW